MACLITSGFPIQCSDSIGGSYEVYIGSYNGTAMTYTTGTGSTVNQITAFTGTTVSFYTFAQEAQVASFKEEGAFAPENGTSLYTQTVEITLPKMSSVLQTQLGILGQGKWRIIVKDNNDNYWYIGAKDGAKVSAMASGTGKAKGDLNGAILTFTSTEKFPAFQVTTAGAAGVITP